MSNITCDECGIIFEDSDTIYRCEDCGSILCESCKENHNCICDVSDFFHFENKSCYECGSVEKEMFECNYCGCIVCENCIDEHIERHKREDLYFEEFSYHEFIKKGIIGSLKD